MNYPVEYTVIAENEKVYIEGGADYEGLFNYFIGDYLRDTVRDEMRNAVWSSARQFSFKPIADWFKGLSNMNPLAQLGYLYGAVRLGETVDGFLTAKK